MTTTIQSLKQAIIEYNNYQVKCMETRNHTYENIADSIYREKIFPYVKNENIDTWELDIKKRFLDDPYCRLIISDKQAYCLARALQKLNPETITV